jgi:hypothetical protein
MTVKPMMSLRILSLFSLTVSAMIIMSAGGALADDAEIWSKSTIYLTIFTPAQGEELALFHPGPGKFCLYALDCKTGEAVFNLDTSNDPEEDALLRKSDREPPTAIPSGLVIALIRGASSSYIGVGGGIDNSDLSAPKAVLRIYWRYVF